MFVQGRDIESYHYLVNFNGNISDVVGKRGRILGTVIFIFNIILVFVNITLILTNDTYANSSFLYLRKFITFVKGYCLIILISYIAHFFLSVNFIVSVQVRIFSLNMLDIII